MSVNYPLPRRFRRQLKGRVPILCLNCGKFVRWGEPEESYLTDPSRNAKRWFCRQMCLYVYAKRMDYDVRIPDTTETRDLDWMLEAMR